MKRFSGAVMALAMLGAVPAFAETKAECETSCDEANKMCEDHMTKQSEKKKGEGDREHKALLAQIKKVCGDAGKSCKADCK